MADLPTDTGILEILNNMCRQAASSSAISSASSSVSAFEAEEELAAELHEDLVELQEEMEQNEGKAHCFEEFPRRL